MAFVLKSQHGKQREHSVFSTIIQGTYMTLCLKSDTQTVAEGMAVKNLVFALLTTNSPWHTWCQILAVCLSRTEPKDALKFLVVI